MVEIYIDEACTLYSDYLVHIPCLIHLQKSGSLTAFTSPSQAITKTLVQLAGEFDFEAVFNQGTLLYTPATYILFFIFLITVPILFSNLLVSCCYKYYIHAFGT